MSQYYLDNLQKQLDTIWSNAFKTSKFMGYVSENSVPRSLYAQYLIETFHYTKHNATNQALVGTRRDMTDFAYQRFCFHHAEEEVGHQQMALNDINHLGYGFQEDELPDALPATKVLVAYLYWISTEGNPVQRLGYSFWAESCYGYIGGLLSKVKQDLSLKEKEMSFFIAHAEIDSEHSAEVERVIKKVCKNEADYEAIAEVMATSHSLTVSMMDAVFEEYQKSLDDQSFRFRLLEQAFHE